MASKTQVNTIGVEEARTGYEAVAVDGDMDDWISEDFQIQPTRDPDKETELGLS
jgi:hypothetical protein